MKSFEFKFFFQFAVLPLLLLPQFVRAGGMEGGGGKSIVCRNSDGSIKSAEVLDLYEARIQYGLRILESSIPYLQQAQEVLSRLGSGRGKDFSVRLANAGRHIDSVKRLLPDGTALKPIDDAMEVIVPLAPCGIEQLANYIDSNTVLVNGEIWSALSETNKAALIAHESVYEEFRMVGASNSIHARKAVAFGFAGVIPEYFGPPQNKPYVFCETMTSSNNYIPTSYWIYNDEDPQFKVVQFDTLDGVLMFTKTAFRTAADFSKFGSFVQYQTNMDESLIEKGLPVGFRDITQINNGTAFNVRMVGIVSSWNEPQIPTHCNF